jgi:hypothetical protein
MECGGLAAAFTAVQRAVIVAAKTILRRGKRVSF